MNPVFWKKADELLADNMAFVVATIVSHEGSTPRTSGTKMIVTGDGKIVGTIGGGLLEARVMERAVKIIENQGPSIFMPFDLSYKDAETMDMICGGRAEIFLDYMAPTQKNIDTFLQWRLTSDERESAFFITAITLEDKVIKRVCHGVISDDKVVAGSLPLPDGILETIIQETCTAESIKVLMSENVTTIIEPSSRPNAAFLFGAGHVAQPTAHLCALVGFHVTVLDDRDTFANADRFPDANDIRVLDSFENAFAGIDVEDDSFIVVFTRGHLHDKTVLAGALNTPAGYIGMIGSRKKRASIYNALKKEGYQQQDIDRVHSPIGLAIGARSPEEIAVSIVAEMIHKRDQMNHE